MNTFNSIHLTVELFAGAHVISATSDLCGLANHLGITVCADFNGVGLMAVPGDDPKDLLRAWDVAIERGFKTARGTHATPAPAKKNTKKKRSAAA